MLAGIANFHASCLSENLKRYEVFYNYQVAKKRNLVIEDIEFPERKLSNVLHSVQILVSSVTKNFMGGKGGGEAIRTSETNCIALLNTSFSP